MILLWWAILIVACVTPTVVYWIVTKRAGGEPFVLKANAEKEKKENLEK